jgi:hypothetical protein
MNQESQYISQELQYLRDEINQSLKLFDEHPRKTINMVLLIWGLASIFLGTKQIEFDDTTLYFFIGTIFFLSDLILYFSVRKAHENMEGIVKIAAYIIVFYEKRPSKIAKVGVDKNISWEIANSELEFRVDSYANRKLAFRMNGEYMVFMIFSTLMLLFFTVKFFPISELKEMFKVSEFLISGLYFLTSLRLLYETRGLLKNFSGARKKYLKAFVKYSLETEHYTKEEIEERLGKDIWSEIKDE